MAMRSVMITIFSVALLQSAVLGSRVREHKTLSAASQCDGDECRRDELSEWCSMNAKNETVLAKFPEFSAIWCDDQLERINAAMSGSDGVAGPTTADLFHMMTEVMNIIKNGQERRWASIAEFGGRWASCGRG